MYICCPMSSEKFLEPLPVWKVAFASEGGTSVGLKMTGWKGVLSSLRVGCFAEGPGWAGLVH